MERIKKFEKGGHCETMKKDVGGRTGRDWGRVNASWQKEKGTGR